MLKQRTVITSFNFGTSFISFNGTGGRYRKLSERHYSPLVSFVLFSFASFDPRFCALHFCSSEWRCLQEELVPAGFSTQLALKNGASNVCQEVRQRQLNSFGLNFLCSCSQKPLSVSACESLYLCVHMQIQHHCCFMHELVNKACVCVVTCDTR